MKKLSKEQFIEKAKLVHGDKYDYSKTIFKNIRTKIDIICPKHGVFKTNAGNHLYNMSGCKKCGLGILSVEDVDKRLFGCNIIRISKYKNTSTQIKVKCLIDNYEWFTRPNTIFNGGGCPKCSHRLPLTNEIVDERLIGRNIKRIDDFINTKNSIRWQCLFCNYIWKARPGEVLSGGGCPKCAGKIQLTNEIVDERLIGRNIKRIDDFINIATKIKFLCLNTQCNNIWEVTPNNILNANHGCPTCSTNKSELNIFKLIKEHIIYDYFEHHKTFIFNNRKYIPDFYIEINNKKIIIEYNGQQHYMPVRFNNISQDHANKNFINQQKRDQELRDYCEENDIILFEINYSMKQNKIIEALQKFNL